MTATRVSGAQAHMTRDVEVAQIPVFQFGVFSDSDLSYFAGPNFDFGGPCPHQWRPLSGGRKRLDAYFPRQAHGPRRSYPPNTGKWPDDERQLYRNGRCANRTERLQQSHKFLPSAGGDGRQPGWRQGQLTHTGWDTFIAEHVLRQSGAPRRAIDSAVCG